jgi:hypothetical protein
MGKTGRRGGWPKKIGSCNWPTTLTSNDLPFNINQLEESTPNPF